MKKVVLIILLMFVLIVNGCITSSEKKYSFNLDISISNEKNVTLVLPFPENWDNFDSKLRKKEISCTVINTNYGKGMQIKLRDNISLELNKKGSDGSYELSMLNRSTGKVPIYMSENVEQNVSIDLRSDYWNGDKSTGSGYLMNTDLKAGWNLYSFDMIQLD